MSRPSARLPLILAAVLALALAPSSSWAASFEVSPVRLALSAAAPTALLTLQNQGTEPVRLQVTAFAWSQSPAGEMVLTPTQDLVVFPTLATVAAGGARKIRVGTTAGFDPVERSYRIFIEELPPLASPGNPGTIRVLTRMGVPVFLQPATPSAVPRIDGLAVTGKTLAFAVRDTGNAHFMSRTVKIAVTDAQGAVVFERDLPGWYVLAGGERRYEVELTAAACATGAKVAVAVATDTLPAVATLAAVRCSP